MLASYYKYEDKLETNRLITRFLTIDDKKTWTEFCGDPACTEFFADFGVYDAEGLAKFWIERQLGRYKEKRYGHHALISKQTGAFIGQCGLLLQEVDGIQELEVGYSIMHRYWGQGFAPEAAKMFMEYASLNKLADSIISIIDKKNFRSQRVAEKNGLAIEKETNWSGLEVYIYRIALPLR